MVTLFRQVHAVSDVVIADSRQNFEVWLAVIPVPSTVDWCWISSDRELGMLGVRDVAVNTHLGKATGKF